MIKVGFGVQKAKSSEATDPFLKKMAISTLLWTILFGIGTMF
jgi:1,4-dihydroxy-2-naphthoate octaprenyltransferase